ncbi:MAG TPA: PEGA domain-containing protein, partial [Thermodesulfobacteriota bacterium]|nr:PEGA domain-containing protein [Thermodesulfobacteriota bacterium]
RRAATTDREGAARVSLPAAGRPVRLTLAADGYLPARWSVQLAPGDGRRELRRYFYPVTPPPIRVGLAGYGGATGAEAALADDLAALGEALADQLEGREAFALVPDLPRKLRFLKLRVETLAERGWAKTPLQGQLDLLVVGSVAAPPGGPLTVETRVYTPDGQLLLAHVKEARDLKRARELARELAEEIVLRFPFEGTIVETLANGRVRINLGAGGGRGIEAGTPVRLFSVRTNAEGRVVGRTEVGTGTIERVEAAVSEVQPERLAPGATLRVGDRVVRAPFEGAVAGATGTVTLVVRTEGEGQPVAAANVYLDGAWVGTTDADGRVAVPVRPRRRYDLLVFRHGFQQLRDSVSFAQPGGERSVALVPALARLTVESVPSGATVSVDGTPVGTTPITQPVPVRLGFRRIRVDAGGDYRAFDRVLELTGPELALVGQARVVLEKDWLRIGERLAAEGRIDEAIAALAQAGPSHPDYSAARHRLGQLYLDEKRDPRAAIEEFERVLAIPENREVILKRFAVVYTNLGHAYYAYGAQIQRKDPEGAARAYRKALEALATARQNTRFFPSASHDEALHDTYYYSALAQHRLADLARSPEAFRRAELAWRQYFDFFPRALEGNPAFERMRQGAEQFWAEARRRAS